MLSKEEIKEIHFKNGVDLFGIASVERFDQAPEGFHPKDIYAKTRSIFYLPSGCHPNHCLPIILSLLLT